MEKQWKGQVQRGDFVSDGGAMLSKGRARRCEAKAGHGRAKQRQSAALRGKGGAQRSSAKAVRGIA